MPNQYKNKVQYIRNGNPETLIDLSNDTVTAATLMQGYTAHDASGAPITGTAVEQGIDIPTFTVTWYDDWSDIYSITCDKTYAECLSIIDDSEILVANAMNDDRSQTGEYGQPVNYYTRYGDNSLRYVVGTPNSPDYDIRYYPNGSIEWTYPSPLVKDSDDLTVSGATVTVPAGSYPSSASKSVASGIEGTPTATKGSVSNHAISVTPSVTNSAGYISGGIHSGTAVAVTASELASGNLALTANTNSTSCVGYSTVSVAIPFVTYYTSSSTPTSSQGSNGDIWLVTS